QNVCMNIKPILDKPDPSSLYGTSSKTLIAPTAKDMVGSLYAISAETGKVLWRHDERAGIMSLVATAGGLGIGGDTAGNVMGVDDGGGGVVGKSNVGGALSGFPITYMVNGKQYVAVSSGPSTVAGNAQRLTPELKSDAPPRIYVYALP